MAVAAEDFRQPVPQPPYQSRVVVMFVVVVVVRVKVVMLFVLVVWVSGVFGAVFGATHLLRVTSLV